MNHRAYTSSDKVERRALAAVILGGAASLVAAVFTPDRFWLHTLAAGQLLLGIGLGAGFLIAVTYVAGGTWMTALRRVCEALTSLLVPGSFLTLLVVFLQPSTWPWVHQPRSGGAAWFREAWLSLPFFQVRSVAYLVIWLLTTWWLLSPSRRQDQEGGLEWSLVSRRRAAAFLVIFGLTFWLAATDWLMALYPHWYSTVFSVYQFAGSFLSALAATALAAARLSQGGPLQSVVTADHFHDLGKMLLAFATFWMYIWFCQFMLIWYANIPEEVTYYLPLVQPWWLPLFLLNVAVTWVIPFGVLLPRASKRRPAVLQTISLLVLAGRALDLYLHVAPKVFRERPGFGFAEAGALLTAAGLAVLAFRAAFLRRTPVPHRDPFLVESLSLRSDV